MQTDQTGSNGAPARRLRLLPRADDVADIDAHAKFDPPCRRHGGIAGDHFALHLDGTAHGVDHTGEFNKEPVAGRLDDATAVLGDLGIAELSADRAQRGERALLILAHQPRIAGNINSKDRCQPALDPLSAQAPSPSGRPARRRPAMKSSATSDAYGEVIGR